MADLSITALYTSAVWSAAQLPCAELFATSEAKRVFDVTNAVLALARRPPLRPALVHRHAMLDHLVGDATRVVEIAAGLSRRGATLSERIDYTEIDLPAVIARKRALLERTPAGRAVLARARFRLVGADVETIALPAAELVIAEGLVIYLDAAARARLFAKVAATGARFVFDLTPSSEEPPPGFAGRLLGAAMKRFTGGRGFERSGTRASMLAELVAAGFEAEAIAAVDVARAWQLPSPEIRTPTVIFSARARRA